MHDCFEDSPLNSKPLVTFALIAYNQERFIREAVEGALAQTYSPLEIIISDDCSQDATFAVMKECVKNYSGPHKVILNRNASNMGLGNHINTVVNLSEGEFIVLAAGDDISYSERTTKLVDAWLSNNKPVAMCSGFDCITDRGAPDGDSQAWYRNFMPHQGENREEKLKRLVCHGVPAMIGCTEAWSKDLFSGFPPLSSGVWFEDCALSFRAWLIGQIHYLPECLVAYRRHKASISQYVGKNQNTFEAIIAQEKKRSLWCSWKISLLLMYKIDLDCALAQKIITNDIHQKIYKLINDQINIYKIRSEWWNKTISNKFLNSIFLIRKEKSWASLRYIFPRLFSIRWFACLKLCKFSVDGSSE